VAELQPEVLLRIAGPSDRDVITSLIASFRDYLDNETPSDKDIGRAVEELLGDPATDFLLAGEPEVGFAQIRYRPSVWTGTDDAWLEDVFVLDRARGDGTGRLLVEAAIARARKRGCGRIQLETNAANLTAVGLYESVGFRQSHLPDRWGETPDVCMTLELG
jgi:GNAT superfamily N-acetyltransferase